MSEIKLTCIVCPNGCELIVGKKEDGSLEVAGNLCPKGVKFAADELEHPVRTFTGTAPTVFEDFPVAPVKINREVPREQIPSVARYVNTLTLTKRYAPGELIEKNVLGLGADLVATADMRPGES